MYHHMEFDPYLIRSVTSSSLERCKRCGSIGGCGETTRCAARDWLPSLIASRARSICFAVWGLQDGNSVRDQQGSAQS
jgi:hypothetical protein